MGEEFDACFVVHFFIPPRRAFFCSLEKRLIQHTVIADKNPPINILSLPPDCPLVERTLYIIQFHTVFKPELQSCPALSEECDPMFTGIVEEVGRVAAVRAKPQAMELTISCSLVLEDVKRGDSISINGVCLTVSTFTKDTFTVDVIPETVKSSTMASLKSGSHVNLERAMPANGRFGGHFVSGHIDGVGVVRSVKKEANAVTKTIEVESRLMKYMMLKGSVAVDGTSLTIFALGPDTITISLIPTTQEDSLVGAKGIGDKVNIECDMLAKYTERIQTAEPKMTRSWLAENGF
jgi:riboflavin synthase